MRHFRSYKTAKRAVMRHNIENQLHMKLWELDNKECCYCGRRLSKNFSKKMRLTIDHVQPVVRLVHLPIETINAEVNIVAACQRCNGTLGAISAEHKLLRYGRFRGKPRTGKEWLPAIYFASAERYLDLQDTSHIQPCNDINLLRLADSCTA